MKYREWEVFYNNNNTTTLRFDQDKYIMCPEHLFGALYFSKISAITIKLVSNSEIPFMDGSAQLFHEAILSAGRVQIAHERRVIVSTEPTTIQGSCPEQRMTISPSPLLRITSTICYSHPIGVSTSTINDNDDAGNVLQARSFIRDPTDATSLAECQRLRLCGLNSALQNNALIIWDSNEFQNSLRHADEPSAHKILDIIGDLYAAGISPCFSLNVVRPGHALNHAVIREIHSQLHSKSHRGQRANRLRPFASPQQTETDHQNF